MFFSGGSGAGYFISPFGRLKEYFIMQMRDDYIFIHIPKNGGSTVIHALTDKWQKPNVTDSFQTAEFPAHVSAKQIRNKIGLKQYNDKMPFAVIRNPFSRCVSFFEFWRRTREKSRERWSEKYQNALIEKELTRGYQLAKSRSFAEFVKAIYEEGMAVPQTFWVCDDKDSVIVDRLCSLQHLQRDLDLVMNKLKRPKPKLGKFNCASYKKHWKQYYTPQLRQIVEKMCAVDFELIERYRLTGESEWSPI